MTQDHGLERGFASPGVRAAYSLHPRSVAPTTAGVIFSDVHLSVAAERPEGYPFEVIRGVTALVCLEGHVYGGGRARLLGAIENLDARALDDDALANRLRACVEDVDGDFVLLWYDRDPARLAIAADRFGRIPLYYGPSADRLVVSRDQGVILDPLAVTAVDPLALAQLLLLGYPLGQRTLAAGVSRLLPREILVASPRGWRLSSSPGSPFRRTVRPDLPRDADGCARRLRDAFVASCRDRCIEAGSHVLSLSGGIDSRTTGAGMRAALPSFSAVTFAAPGSSHADERTIAAEVARVLGARWRSYEFDPADRACIDGIIRMKLGLNPVDVAFGIDYVRRVEKDFTGPVAFWTGEGADKLLCEHRAIPPRPRHDELVRFILEKNAVMEPDRVAALTGVRANDVVESIRTAVASDDVEPEDAYVHFLLSQRVVRYHTEGEDRHRWSVWPISPFFGAGFLALVRAVPGAWKRERRLYRAFLRALAPDVAALPLAGGHAAPASRQFALEYMLRERLRNNRRASALYRRVRRARGASPGGPWNAMLARLLREGLIPEPLNAAEVERVASGATPATPFALSVLLTAALAVRAIRSGAATAPSAGTGSP